MKISPGFTHPHPTYTTFFFQTIQTELYWKMSWLFKLYNGSEWTFLF